MKQKKVPMRMCLACRESKPKGELIRVVKNKEGEIFLDKTGKANGRGAYLCPNRACFDKAIKSRAIQRALEVELNEATIRNLEKSYAED